MALVFPLLLTVSALLLQAYVYPLPLHPLTPLFAYLALHTSLLRALWIAAAIGLLPDLFASTHFGLYPAAAVGITAVLSRFRHLVPLDKPLPFALLTAAAGVMSPLAHLILLFLFDNPPPLSGQWLFVELLPIPLLDGAAGLLLAWGPVQLYQMALKRWKVYQLMQEQALSE